MNGALTYVNGREVLLSFKFDRIRRIKSPFIGVRSGGIKNGFQSDIGEESRLSIQ